MTKKHHGQSKKQKLLTKISKKGLQKLQKLPFLIEKASFLTKNTHKIETNCPRDLKLGLKQSLEYPFCDQRCSQKLFFQNWGLNGLFFSKGQIRRSGTQQAVTRR